MRLHSLEHAPFEGPANIAEWAVAKGYSVSRTALYRGESLPEMNAFDWLVVMGGPMNIYEEEKYPWLAREKKFIKRAIAEKKIVLGVCLGAQLIADVLGGSVYKNHHKEIGWHPVHLTRKGRQSPLFKGLEDCFTAFHWHGDTFELPAGCQRLAETDVCLNQAFSYSDHVVALQFHLENTGESLRQLIENCGHELVAGKFIQTAGEIQMKNGCVQDLRKGLDTLLDNIEEACRR